MKQLLTAILAGVGLLAGLNAAIAAGDHATQKAAPNQMRLAAGSTTSKDATTHPKAKAETQGAKKATKGLRKQDGKFRGAETHEETT